MDTIKFRKAIATELLPTGYFNNENEFTWEKLEWKRIKNLKYKAKIKNLYLILESGYLTISNSLQKFYHGNNYGIFTAKEIIAAILQLDRLFSFSILDADVIKYSPGVVIETKPKESFENWLEYKGKKTHDMLDKGKIYGSFFNTGQIKVKAYNKTYQANKNLAKQEKINKNLVRLEAEIYASYARNNYGIYIKKVSDLISLENINKTFDLLLKLYDNIKKDLIDYSVLTPLEIRLIGLFTNYGVAKKYKENHPHSFKKDKSTYNRIFKDNRKMKDDLVRSKIIDTINYIKTH